jgi:hypothetical protein
MVLGASCMYSYVSGMQSMTSSHVADRRCTIVIEAGRIDDLPPKPFAVRIALVREQARLATSALSDEEVARVAGLVSPCHLVTSSPRPRRWSVLPGRYVVMDRVTSKPDRHPRAISFAPVILKPPDCIFGLRFQSLARSSLHLSLG